MASAVLLGLEAEPLQYASRVTQFDLILNTQEWRDGSASGLRAFFTYRADLFERPAIERFARHWLRLLDGVVRDPHASVGSLPIMDDAEVAAVLSAGAPSSCFRRARLRRCLKRRRRRIRQSSRSATRADA